MTASGDAEFARRLRSLDKPAMSAGKTIPSRKLLCMVAYRAIRDPQWEDGLREQAFRNLTSDGGSIAQAIAFLDSLLELLGDSREDLFSATSIEKKVIDTLKRYTSPQLKKDLLAYASLHPCDPFRAWQYLPGILKRIHRGEWTALATAADAKAVAGTQPIPPLKKLPPITPLPTMVPQEPGQRRHALPPPPSRLHQNCHLLLRLLSHRPL